MSNTINIHNDPNAAARKADHIDLAINSRTAARENDSRFYYEPMIAAHPSHETKMARQFLGKTFNFPIWISSMTGGTEKARIINQNLAKVAGKFGLGMGLGSCRSLLDSDEYLDDFDVKKWMGDQPLYTNLGIAQVEILEQNKQLQKIAELNKKLSADGLIIHVNPMQEFIQPEGDFIQNKPVDTIRKVLDQLEINIIVKEVGQGFGPGSMRALMRLPLQAIEFAAFGGTNFAALELSRTSEMPRALFRCLSPVGHTGEEMIHWVNMLKEEIDSEILCDQFIISGGISDFLDGYYAISKIRSNAVYGMASGFLKYAMQHYEHLEQHVDKHIEGLKLANAFLKVR
ncbi:MAG TPA: type 2 isopentenyl-diphosphate Delta-isomerase [Saprospirales bacterium]|nr:type 2 isopentenyl-diphosphate Delta-isomerase [Saprospirales bacterium]HRQ30964.1 isopentenyl-diphosphate delta-isomerase [Saprospiraceae bacterium]